MSVAGAVALAVLVACLHELIHYVSARDVLAGFHVDLRKGMLGFRVKRLRLRDLLLPQVLNPAVVLAYLLGLIGFFELFFTLAVHLALSLWDYYLAFRLVLSSAYR